MQGWWIGDYHIFLRQDFGMWRGRIHIDHGFIGSSDLDQGNPVIARIMTSIVGRWIGDAAKNEKKRKKLKDMFVANFGMDMDPETDRFMDCFAYSMVSLHPKTVAREFFSDYVTQLEDDIHVDGTTVHIIYALKPEIRVIVTKQPLKPGDPNPIFP